MLPLPRLSTRPPAFPAFVLLVAWLVAIPAAAVGRDGISSARVIGTVTDPDGARVPRARVVLASAATAAATAEASAEGEFHFDQVVPGRYEVRALVEGFRADPVAVAVSAGQEATVAISLHLSAVSESVVVSAAQVELPLARAADSVSVITNTELKAAQIETVADALRAVPGLTVSRNGGRGTVTSLFPRGGESDFTLVLVDGMKANEFGGGYDFSSLTSSNVERIEVVRGPQSALFGADAMGAVVQIVTRHGGSPRAEGSIEGGNMGTSRVAAGTWGSLAGWSWGASGERTASDGFTGTAPATGETVSNDDSLLGHGSIGVGWRGKGGADVRVTGNYTSLDRGYPGPYGSNPIGAYTSVDRYSRGLTKTTQAGARWTQPFAPGGRQVRQTVSASYLDVRSDFLSSYGLSASKSRRLDLRSQTDVTLAETIGVSAGVEFQREEATSTYIIAEASDPVPIDRWVGGLFAEARYQPTAPVTVTAGVRIERIERDALARSLDPYSPRPTFGVDRQTSMNPRISAAWLLAGSRNGSIGWTRLHAGAGTGIRPPTAFEIAFTDNPELKPERTRSVEVGVDQALLRERALVAATGFYNRYDDLIVTVGRAMADASQYRTDNISNARARGVELSASVRPVSGFTARLAYTFLDTEIMAVDRVGSVAAAPFTVGDPLVRRPRHVASLDITYGRGRLAAFARVGARARALDIEPSWGADGGLFYNPGFTIVDAGAAWKVTRGIEIIGRVGNLFNRAYEETFGYPALGRNAMIGVRFAAGR
jgi:outer membrane cobalamin receptor